MPVSAPLFPVGLVVAGQACLVVGAGPVAARKAAALLECGAGVTVVAPDISPAVEALDGVVVERREYRPGEASEFRVVITATGDRQVDQQVFDDAVAAGVLVNSADDPERCTFTLPAVLRRGPITVAVATGGESPAYASWLRTEIGSLLGREYDELAALLIEVRAGVVASGSSTEGLDWRSALDSDMLDAIREGRVGDARERLLACLNLHPGASEGTS